jgi:amino acid permease
MFRAVAQVTAQAWKRASPRRETLDQELLAFTAVGYVAFIVVYSLRYRDFSTMKAEFLFPGLLAYVLLFADEVARAATQFSRQPRLRQVAGWMFVVLLALYVTDVVVLAVQLT